MQLMSGTRGELAAATISQSTLAQTWRRTPALSMPIQCAYGELSAAHRNYLVSLARWNLLFLQAISFQKPWRYF